jgi:glucosamine kinase
VTDLLVGVDVGGTKTHVQARSIDGTIVEDRILATDGWRGASDVVKAGLVASWMAEVTAGAVPLAIGVGAHGCDTAEQCRGLHDALSDRVDVPCAVVNDAHLLGAAAGVDEAIGLIAGTGSIAAGWSPAGEPVYAGGWGWLLGDDGGAAGLVREATRRALAAHDDGQEDEILSDCLLRSAAVTSLGQLSMSMITGPGGAWTRHCPAVFEAAELGSRIASDVIDDGGAALADLVANVRRRGAVGTVVVAGGGVIVNQPRLASAVAAALTASLPEATLQVLTDPPVKGAVALARRALTGSDALHRSPAR